MPWRDDFVKTFWLDPDWVGLAGYPGQDDESVSESPETRKRPTPNQIEKPYPTYRKKAGTRERIGAAIIVIRDRIGFEYEREVGLEDFVSVREAAQLLEVPVMTLTRWVKSKRIRSSKRKGFVVIRLSEVIRMAKERNLNPKLGFRLTIIR
jgi:excisionase family DNA binding protein